jgi:hypothetical protein
MEAPSPPDSSPPPGWRRVAAACSAGLAETRGALRFDPVVRGGISLQVSASRGPFESRLISVTYGGGSRERLPYPT